MPMLELLCHMTGFTPYKLSKNENQIVEAELFTRICDELKNLFKIYYQNYFNLMKLNTEMENTMLESTFMQNIINDILTTEEYTLEGIAYYTQSPEEVIIDILTGKNQTPSLQLARKIIEIHRTLRPELYSTLIKKIISHDTSTEQNSITHII
jgi:hypothetical protein